MRVSSRQNKQRNKKRVRDSVVYETDEKGKRVQRRKGPARTSPSHGKVNRWPYDAEARKKILSKGSPK